MFVFYFACDADILNINRILGESKRVWITLLIMSLISQYSFCGRAIGAFLMRYFPFRRLA
jgi:hypothetical protein